MKNNINQDKEFLGAGWSFPPTFSKRKQSVEMLEGEEDIQSSLRILMTTQIGERVMREKYGSKVSRMIFEPMDSSQREILRMDIMDAVYLHEPRIVPKDVKVEFDSLEGKITITLEYKVIATNTRRNFVYPFYQIEGTEIRK